MNPRRMEAEAVRDNVLRVAGNLDLTLGGPDLDPETGLTSPRRSLYFRHAKEKRVTFLRLFDSSNVLSCYRRTRERRAPAGAGPGQQLARLRPGAPAGRRDHRQLAQKSATATDAAFVAAAFERVLGRDADGRGAGRVPALPGRAGQAAGRPIAADPVRARGRPPRPARPPTPPSGPARAWSTCC